MITNLYSIVGTMNKVASMKKTEFDNANFLLRLFEQNEETYIIELNYSCRSDSKGEVIDDYLDFAIARSEDQIFARVRYDFKRRVFIIPNHKTVNGKCSYSFAANLATCIQAQNPCYYVFDTIRIALTKIYLGWGNVLSGNVCATKA